MTLHLFEGPVHGPVCYCVPGGAASCATCREKREEKAAFDVTKESNRIAEAAGMTVDPASNPQVGPGGLNIVVSKSRSGDFYQGHEADFVVFDEAAEISPRIYDSDKVDAFVYGMSPAQSPIRRTFMEEYIKRFMADAKDFKRLEQEMFGGFSYDPKRAVITKRTATEVAARQQGKTDKVLVTEFVLAALNDPTIVEKLTKAGASFDIRANAWLKKGEMPGLKRHDAPKLDGLCRWMECQGTYEEQHRSDADGCSCHISPPCGWCTDTYLACTDCGDEPE